MNVVEPNTIDRTGQLTNVYEASWLSPDGDVGERRIRMLDINMTDPFVLTADQISHCHRCLAAAYFRLHIDNTCMLIIAERANVWIRRNSGHYLMYIYSKQLNMFMSNRSADCPNTGRSVQILPLKYLLSLHLVRNNDKPLINLKDHSISKCVSEWMNEWMNISR